MTNAKTSSTPVASRIRIIRRQNRNLAAEFRTIVACLIYSNLLEQSPYTEIARKLERYAAASYKRAQQRARQIGRLGGVPFLTSPEPAPNHPKVVKGDNRRERAPKRDLR